MTSINLTAFGRPALWLALRRAWVDWAALLVSLALASLALHWSHVSWLLQLETVAILSVATLAGVFVASLPRVQYPDFILFANAAFVIGVVLLSTSAFVLSHNALFGNVPFGTQLGRVWLGFAVIALIGGAGLWTLRRPQLIFAPTLNARATAILLGAATIVFTAVHISFFDGPQISPGNLIDRIHQVVDFPNDIRAMGFPQTPFRHRGVELLLLQFQGWLGEPGVWNRISAYKVASLAFFFVFAYATYAIARHGFGASRLISVLAGNASLVFGAIFPTFWAFGNLARSSYLGLYSPAGSFYHNATHLFSHGMAATGVALIGIALKRRVNFIAVACLLIAASTFYIPSFILYFIPAMFLLVPVLYLTGRITRT